MPEPVKLIALLKAAPGMSREEFDSPEAEAAAADVNEFVALQTLPVTRETVMRDKDEALG